MLIDIELKSGVIAKWMELLSSEINFKDNLASVEYGLWLDEDTYMAGKDRLEARTKQVDIAVMSEKLGVANFLRADIQQELTKK